MKKYLILILFLGKITTSTSQNSPNVGGVTKIPCETCYQEYGIRFNISMYAYIESTNKAFDNMLKSLGQTWTTEFFNGYSQLKWATF